MRLFSPHTMSSRPELSRRFFFFFNDTATTEIYTLSLHDALPILRSAASRPPASRPCHPEDSRCQDRKSTRLNSSHPSISYAVFCLKKKKAVGRWPSMEGKRHSPFTWQHGTGEAVAKGIGLVGASSSLQQQDCLRF